MAIISSDVATGRRIKGVEGAISEPPPYGAPPKPPPGRPPPRRSDAIAVLQSPDSESRFWNRHRVAPRPVWPPHSLAMSALQVSAILACACARWALRAASEASPEAEG